MSTITRGRIVDYTYRRSGELEAITRPAIVTDVRTVQTNAPYDARRPRNRELVDATAVSLVVFDEQGSRRVDADVFEDAVCENGAPAYGCWAWPEHMRAPAATAATDAAKMTAGDRKAAADKNGAKKKR